MICLEKRMDNNVIEKWIGLDEAAEYLGIKPVTLRKWIKTKENIKVINAIRKGCNDD